MTSPAPATYRDMPFIPRDIAIERRSDGTVLLSSRIPLVPGASSLSAYLRRQSETRPDAAWIAQRSGEGWRSITFGEARRQVDSLAQALLDLRVPAGKSLVILSTNSIEHAMITFAAFQVGIPVAPLTAAYALQASAAKQLEERLAVVDPSVFFVQNGRQYAASLDRLDPALPVISVDDPRTGDLHFADLVGTMPGPAVDAAFDRIDPDAPARYMFTSGSSGAPKAVIQTQRNVIVAVESNLTAYGQIGRDGIRRLDWMPWSHVTGAAVLAATLISGGTFFIDDGRPMGDDFARTLANLRHVSPTNYFSMPAGYIMLADALEQDRDLAQGFFARLLTMGYGGARLPDDVARRMQALAIEHTGYKIPFVCGYGSTETGPGGALVYWPTDRVGMIGLPQPGFEMKLVPLDGERYEVRVRSAAVTPGYLGEPEKTAAMLDDEGYFSMGDAAAFVSPDDPLQGLAFAGRMSDEFKLVTGTFVRTGELQELVLTAAPLLLQVVLCGEGEAYVAILAWLNLRFARELAGRPEATIEELNRDDQVVRAVKAAVAGYNLQNNTSSRKIVRFALQDSPPSAEAGELADKGSIRAGVVRRLRAEQVRDLYRDPPPPQVHLIDG
jgi:feruloyl-CoA synthase